MMIKSQVEIVQSLFIKERDLEVCTNRCREHGTTRCVRGT